MKKIFAAFIFLLIAEVNEKGLVVELMWLSGSEYPKPDKRSSMMVLQWVQYQLDNFSTVEEVIASDEKVRISPLNNPPLHYLVADANGHSATIEFLNGKTVFHKGNNLPLPVLTNTDYSTSAEMVKDVASSAASTSVTYRDNSVQRFANACSMVQTFQQTDIKKPIVDYAFDILTKVQQPGFTKWSIVYDISNKKIFFKTASAPDLKSVTFAEMNFDCGKSPVAFNMNQPVKGNVAKQFVPYSNTVNEKLVEKAAEESESRVNITDAEIRRTVAYAAAITCGK